MQRLGAARRWLAVAAAAAIVVAIPAVVSGRPESGRPGAAAALLARARASAGIAYHGYVESTGSLGLPSVGWLRDPGALLGGSSRIRVWWAGPVDYRVDLLTAAGERDTYRNGTALTLWDSDRRRVTFAPVPTGPHPPVAADLTPPALGRRLLAPATAAEVSAGPLERVAGRRAERLDVRPADPRALAGLISVWVDTASGLPLRVAVAARGGRHAVLRTGFLDVHLGRPAPSVLRFVPPDDADLVTGAQPSITDLGESAPVRPLPASLAGLPRRADVGPDSPVATYGRGYVLVAVMPMTAGDAQVLVSRYASPLNPVLRRGYGDEIALGTPLFSALMVARPDLGFVVVGTVSVRDLERVARSLAGALG